MARGGWVSEWQPGMQRHEPSLGSGADERERKHDCGDGWRRPGGPNLGEGVMAFRAGHEAEGEEQHERAEARHQKIHIGCVDVLAQMMMRQHQRPG